MIRPYLLLLLSITVSVSVAQSGTVSGTVTDRKTGESLPGATIVLDGTDLGSTTDMEGFFCIKDIKPGSYNLTASYIGYETQSKFNIIIRSEGNPAINVQLEERTQQLNDVVVVANPFLKNEETPLSIQKLSLEEVATYPGGNNDITKVVQSLPGVSGSVGGFRNDIIIRGGSPAENVYYLDGIEIPIINHFSTQGSAGGPVGLLNVSFIEGVTISTSSFAAQYDNVLSGVLQFDQRKGNDQKFVGNVRVGASESAFTFEGPLFKGDKERSNTSAIVSVRRSYLQFLFDLIGLPILPDYWDYQYKVSHKIDDHNELLITGIGSIDDFSVNELDEFDPEQQAIQDQVPIIKQRTNTIGASWKHRFKDNSGFLQTSVSTNTLNNDFLQYDDNINQAGLYFSNKSREQEGKLRASMVKFMGNSTLTAGLSLQSVNYKNSTSDIVNGFDYGTKLRFARYGIFGQWSSTSWGGKFKFSFGLRADGNSYTETGNDLSKTISPRVSTSLHLSEKLSWNSSVGRYYKLPPYTILGFKDTGGNSVNKSSRYIRSDHLVSGFEFLLSSSSRVTAEGFAKYYDNYPVSVKDDVSVANKGGGFEVLGNEPIQSIGKGRSYGVEFLYQQKFNGKIYAIAALTLYRSEFTGSDRTIYKPSSWDNGQVISLTSGYKFGNNWEISAKFRYLGKAPYAPVDETATLANYPAIIKDYSQLGTVRLSAFNQLDIRIDKQWNLRKFNLELYIDFQNVLVTDTPSEPSYGLSRDSNGTIIQPESLVVVNANDTGSLIPSLGLVVNF